MNGFRSCMNSWGVRSLEGIKWVRITWNDILLSFWLICNKKEVWWGWTVRSQIVLKLDPWPRNIQGVADGVCSSPINPSGASRGLNYSHEGCAIFHRVRILSVSCIPLEVTRPRVSCWITNADWSSSSSACTASRRCVRWLHLPEDSCFAQTTASITRSVLRSE